MTRHPKDYSNVSISITFWEGRTHVFVSLREPGGTLKPMGRHSSHLIDLRLEDFNVDEPMELLTQLGMSADRMSCC